MKIRESIKSIIPIALVALSVVFFILGNLSRLSNRALQQEIEATRDLETFNITAKDFKFEPDELRVKKGSKVRLFLLSEDLTYTVVIDEYDIYVLLTPEKPGIVEFIASKIGTFNFGCGQFCESQGKQMSGRIIVQ